MNLVVNHFEVDQTAKLDESDTVSSLSIIIPCYNEAATVGQIVARVLGADTAGLKTEIILVDDGSNDGSAQLIREVARRNPLIHAHFHPTNRGKGATIRSALSRSTGDVILIQDADLEYDPADYPRLLRPIVQGKADGVYGSRFKTGEVGRVLCFWHSVANWALTTLSNMFTNLNLSDMETGFKVIRREFIEQIDLRENGFGIEPEITAKLARLTHKPRTYEVRIGYTGRNYEQGKKIRWWGGARAVYCVIRYSMLR